MSQFINKKMIFIMMIVTFALSTLLVGCGQSKETNGSENTNSEKTSGETTEEIKIGAIYPLTGTAATMGGEYKKAIEFTAELINNKYDVDIPFAKTEGIPSLGGAKIKVVFADSANKPEQAASEAERMISREKVAMLTGAYSSANTATIAQVAERSGIPFLNAESTSPSLTKRGYKWFFRTTPDDETFVKSFFEFMDDMKEKGTDIKTVAILNENSLWGTDTAKIESELAKKYGYEVIETVSYPANTTDLSGAVQKLKSANPDVLLATSYTSDAILFMKTAKDLGFSPKAMITHGTGFMDTSFLEAMGDKAENVISRDAWSLDLVKNKPVIGQLNNLYKEKYGKDLTGNQARVIQGFLVIADALERAGSTKPEELQKALLATDLPAKDLIMSWEGIKFDPQTHQNIKADAILVQLKGGKYSTIWPFNYAVTDVIWPYSKQ